MQISSNHSGYNFSSVYQSVVTRHAQPMHEKSPSDSVAREATSTGDDGKPERLQRETVMLQAANRAAGRAADQLDATPDL